MRNRPSWKPSGFDEVAPSSPRDISAWAYDLAADRVEILDNRALGVPCYHPGYTLVEKLQAIATKYRLQQAGGQFPPNFMRHYYDVASLLQDETVQAFVATPEDQAYKAKHFPVADNPVIAQNAAFALPDPDARARLQAAYAASSALYYAGQPRFETLLDQIAAWADRL